MSLECPTHGTDWQPQCYRCALDRPSTGLSREVHHAELSDNPGPSQGKTGQMTRPVNIEIVYDMNDAVILCRDCQQAITSFTDLLIHRCPTSNTVQSSPGQ